MSLSVPSLDEQPLAKCRALYLGTSVFNDNANTFDEASLNLAQIQDTIGLRYPIDGSNYAKGVETWLSVFPSGVQMEHSSKNSSPISALFYYPIKSLVYCGALRYVTSQNLDKKTSKFVPLDTDIAQASHNAKNPPLFVILVKGIDPNSKNQIIECHVLVVGLKKTSMKLVEGCQKAYGMSKESLNEFYKKYGNVPVVYCMKNDLSNKSDKRVVVKSFDLNGYYYATESTPIDLWQLFESANPLPISIPANANNFNEVLDDKYTNADVYTEISPRADKKGGYYSKWSKEKSKTSSKHRPEYEVKDMLCNDEINEENSGSEQPPIIVRQEKTPSPIIFEKYIKKKQPQVIIKEIYVTEPAPPPIKYVQNMPGQIQPQLNGQTIHVQRPLTTASKIIPSTSTMNGISIPLVSQPPLRSAQISQTINPPQMSTIRPLNPPRTIYSQNISGQPAILGNPQPTMIPPSPVLSPPQAQPTYLGGSPIVGPTVNNIPLRPASEYLNALFPKLHQHAHAHNGYGPFPSYNYPAQQNYYNKPEVLSQSSPFYDASYRQYRATPRIYDYDRYDSYSPTIRYHNHENRHDVARKSHAHIRDHHEHDLRYRTAPISRSAGRIKDHDKNDERRYYDDHERYYETHRSTKRNNINSVSSKKLNQDEVRPSIMKKTVKISNDCKYNDEFKIDTSSSPKLNTNSKRDNSNPRTPIRRDSRSSHKVTHG